MKLSQNIFDFWKKLIEIYLNFNLLGKVCFGIYFASGFFLIFVGIVGTEPNITFISGILSGFITISIAGLFIIYIDYINKTYNKELFINYLSSKGVMQRLEYFITLILIQIAIIGVIFLNIFSQFTINYFSSKVGFLYNIPILFFSFIRIISYVLLFLSFDYSLLVSYKRIRDIGGNNYWLIILIIIPIVNILYFLPSNTFSNKRICPHCAETIKAEAKVCRYCNRELLT